MKKLLACLLSLTLILSSTTAVRAEESTSSDEIPASFHTGENDTASHEADLSGTGLAQTAALAENQDGSSVALYESTNGSKYLLTNAQKVFVLSRQGEISDAEWFDMDTSDFGSGKSSVRIKKAILKGESVLLGDELLVTGWDDDYQKDGTAIPGSSEGTEASDSEKTPETSRIPGQENESQAGEVLTEEPTEAESQTASREMTENDSARDEEDKNQEDSAGEFPDIQVKEAAADLTNQNTNDEEPFPEEEKADGEKDDSSEDSVKTDELKDADNAAAASEGDVSDTNASYGAWRVKNLDDSSEAYIPYDDSSLLSREVLCLTWRQNQEAVYRYGFDGGIGDGRLNSDNFSAGELLNKLEKEGKTPDLSEDDQEKSPWMAVMYTASHNENLTEVSFYTDTDNCSYDIQVYLYPKTGKPVTGDALYTDCLTGKAESAGLHTVTLPEKAELEEGDRFTVAIRFHTGEAGMLYDTDASYSDETGEVTAVSKASRKLSSYIGYGDAFISLDSIASGNWRIGAVTDYTDTSDEINNQASEKLTDGGLYEIVSASNQQYALDIQGGNVTARTNVQLYKRNHTNAQKWYAHLNSDGSWSFVSYLSGRALDIYGNNIIAGTNVQIHTARYTASQRFKLTEGDKGGYYIEHIYSGLPLGIAGGSISAGANIQLGEKNGSETQSFVFERVTEDVYTGSWFLTTALSSSHVLASANGRLVVQNKTRADNQIFSLSQTGDGYYYLTDSANGLRISISGKAIAYRTVISEKASLESDNQKWRIVKNDDNTYSFFAKAAPHICLQLDSASAGENGTVRTGSWTKSAQQKFYLRDAARGELDGTVTIRSANYPDRVLDVADGSSASGANIQSYNSNNTAAQKFTLKKADLKSSDPVYYIMTGTGSGMALAYEGSLVNNANVVQMTYTGADSQKWRFKANDDGTYTISAYQNDKLCLDIDTASIDYRVNVRVHNTNSTPAQKWYLAGQTITSCQLTAANKVTVSGTDAGQNSDDGKIYLVAVNPVSYLFNSQQVLASVSAGGSFTLTSGALDMQTYINDEFFTAVKVGGIYHLSSNGFYITNPERAASRMMARTEPINKKGIQADWNSSIVDEAINTLHVKHIAFNIPLLTVVSGSGASFTWKGTTYNFNGSIPVTYKNLVRKLNAAGVQVTCIVYADAAMGQSRYADYVTPGGRGASSAGAVLAGMNAQEETGRSKLEAAFAFLASTFSDADAHVDNWVIGNELDDAHNWNYCGDNLPIKTYVTLYTQVYRLAYNTMKSIWSNVQVYDSLDNVWNVDRGNNYYRAKLFQDDFNSILNGEGAINWGLAFHPYCAPEQDPRFWLYPSYATEDAATTSRITMLNINVLSEYCRTAYGSGHSIILSETGINARNYYNGGGADAEQYQAAAVAYAYYLAEAASGIDNLVIHAWKDSSGETAGNWYLGMKDINGNPRMAYYVFANMDSLSNGFSYTQTTKSISYQNKPLISLIVQNGRQYTSWTQFPKLTGLNAADFGDSRY